MIVEAATTVARRVDDALEILPLFDGTGFAFDVARASLRGEHPTLINRVSDRAYYFLDGDATVRVGDDEYRASPGSLILIRAGLPHGLSGNADYLIITAPPFDPANESVVGVEP